MSLADERSLYRPTCPQCQRRLLTSGGLHCGICGWMSAEFGESWRETMERELAPKALDHNESTNVSFIRAGDDRCISCGAEVDHYLGCPDDPDPDYEAEAELPERLVNVPRPGQEPDRSEREPSVTGPGHPDFISAMSDDDFWTSCRWELKRLAWMASEPFALPAWTVRTAAA